LSNKQRANIGNVRAIYNYVNMLLFIIREYKKKFMRYRINFFGKLGPIWSE